MNRSSRAALLASTLLACASLPAFAQGQAVNDPIEPINRGFFALNEVLDTIIVKPIALLIRITGLPIARSGPSLAGR